MLQDRIESGSLDPFCLALRLNLNLWTLNSDGGIRFNQTMPQYSLIFPSYFHNFHFFKCVGTEDTPWQSAPQSARFSGFVGACSLFGCFWPSGNRCQNAAARRISKHAIAMWRFGHAAESCSQDPIGPVRLKKGSTKSTHWRFPKSWG